jgi:hypothetical protein
VGGPARPYDAGHLAEHGGTVNRVVEDHVRRGRVNRIVGERQRRDVAAAQLD